MNRVNVPEDFSISLLTRKGRSSHEWGLKVVVVNREPISVLLVEDDAEEAVILRRSLNDVPGAQLKITHAETLAGARALLVEGGFQIIILDLGLPDADGLYSFLTLQEEIPQIPIIVLTGVDDENIALKAVKSGAQDYIVKGQVRPEQQFRAIQYAIERQKLLVETWEQSMMDDLTGVYNRRGFINLGENQIKLSERMGKDLLLIYVDMDGMKGINDVFGHAEGDKALCGLTKILQKTFRETDVIGRMGGDEFVVLAIGTSPEFIDIIFNRLKNNLADYNGQEGVRHELQVSTGVAFFNHQSPHAIEDLIHSADEQMYECKKAKRSRRK